MRLMRYFARYYAGVIVLTLASLVVLVVAVTLVENAGELTRTDSGGFTALRLAYYSAIEYGYQVLPVAAFVAVLVAGTQMARRGEVLAVQAAGRGPLHLWGPYIGIVVLFALTGSACGEYIVPRAIAGRQRIQREEIRHVDALTQFYTRRAQWFREGSLLLYLPSVDAATGSFADPMVYRLENGLIAEIIEARTLRHEPDGWWLDDAEIRRVRDAEIQRLPRLQLPLHVTPTDLIDVTGNPREMGTGEVSRLITRRQNAGFDTTAHRVELHTRMAFPLSAIWLVAMAVPWALDPDRRRSLAVTLGGGVVAIAIELSVTQVFRLLALAHKIPAPIGAWGAPLLCIVAIPLSYWLYQYRRIHGAWF